MRLLFVGPPGSGKGTQCEVLSDALGVPHISTGDLLRKASRIGGVTGRRAQHFMSAGRLVPDRLVLRILEVRLAEPDVRSRLPARRFPAHDRAGAARSRRCAARRGFDAVVELGVAPLGRARSARRRVADRRSRHSVQRRLDIFERVTVPMMRGARERYPLIRGRGRPSGRGRDRRDLAGCGEARRRRAGGREPITRQGRAADRDVAGRVESHGRHPSAPARWNDDVPGSRPGVSASARDQSAAPRPVL